jgi:flagellar biosynthesis protein FliQ
MSTLISESIRLFFLIAFPLSVAVIVLSLLGAVLQAATTVREQAGLYGLKILGVIVVLSLFLPSWLANFLTFSGDAFSLKLSL